MSQNLRASHLSPQAQNITPANFLTIPRNAFISLDVTNRATNVKYLFVSGTVLRPDSSIQSFSSTFENLTAGTTTNISLFIPEGLLLGIVFNTKTGLGAGITCNIQASLKIGDSITNTTVAYIGTFYLSPDIVTGYPYGVGNQNVNPTMLTLTATKTNGIGTDLIQITSPSLAYIELISLSFTLTTDATVANRFPLLGYGGTTNKITEAPNAQTASTAKNYVIANFGQSSIDLTDVTLVNAPKIFAQSTTAIVLSIVNGVAGDTITNIFYLYKLHNLA